MAKRRNPVPRFGIVQKGFFMVVGLYTIIRCRESQLPMRSGRRILALSALQPQRSALRRLIG